jgi:hypothetical protein
MTAVMASVCLAIVVEDKLEIQIWLLFGHTLRYGPLADVWCYLQESPILVNDLMGLRHCPGNVTLCRHLLLTRR